MQYCLENKFATFYRTAERLGVFANAEPGRFVTFLPHSDHDQRRYRTVNINVKAHSFTIRVPHDLAKLLRTAHDESDRLRNLAMCFERAYIATIGRHDFIALGLEQIFGQFDDHVTAMHHDGYDTLARELFDGLGRDAYEELSQAVVADLGFEPGEQKVFTSDAAGRHRSVRALARRESSALALFQT